MIRTLFSLQLIWLTLLPVTISLGNSAALTDSLDIKIGQMILVGIHETALTPNSPILKEIAQGKVGGIILFEKSITPTGSFKNLKKLITDLQKPATIPLFITIDQEGGQVNRLKTKYGFPASPSAAYIGRVDNPDTTKYYADNTAFYLSRLGINVNFAPSVDIEMKTNPVLGARERCYSADPMQIVKHATQVINSHHYFGVYTVIKHFPGHGSSRSDSHLGVTDVTKYWKPEELLPYQSLIDSGKVDAVMTAHIVNEQLDPAKLPATLSSRIVTGILREKLHFDGVVFSDDMQMYAISKEYGLEQAVKLSILAGVDVLLFSNNISGSNNRAADEVHATIKKLVLNGTITPSRIDQSYQRIIRLKRKNQI
jgi:beta-N-acetylhexosaminidase